MRILWSRIKGHNWELPDVKISVVSLAEALTWLTRAVEKQRAVAYRGDL
jgi:hypothetical protein